MTATHPTDRSQRTRSRSAGRGGIALAIPLAALFLAIPSLRADSQDDFDRSRVAYEQWIETRRLISKERLERVQKRESLIDRIDLVKREIESLRAKIVSTEASIGEEESSAVELEERRAELKDASAGLVATIGALEARTKALLQRVPDPLRERVKPLSQQIPDDPATTALSLGKRFESVIGILNDVTKFNSEITVTTGRRELPDGTEVEVTELYLGISHGYYVNGPNAGVGRASADGWEWTPANESAKAIGDAIAILENEKIAEYVPVPVRIDGGDDR